MFLFHWWHDKAFVTHDNIIGDIAIVGHFQATNVSVLNKLEQSQNPRHLLNVTLSQYYNECVKNIRCFFTFSKGTVFFVILSNIQKNMKVIGRLFRMRCESNSEASDYVTCSIEKIVNWSNGNSPICGKKDIKQNC